MSPKCPYSQGTPLKSVSHVGVRSCVLFHPDPVSFIFDIWPLLEAQAGCFVELHSAWACLTLFFSLCLRGEAHRQGLLCLLPAFGWGVILVCPISHGIHSKYLTKVASSRLPNCKVTILPVQSTCLAGASLKLQMSCSHKTYYELTVCITWPHGSLLCS
jgi:hypothetical protein